jgi:hypothetical protein
VVTSPKINELRALLDLPPREGSWSRGTYDAEVVEKLRSADFSPLGASHNLTKIAVLNFAGIGFTPAPDVGSSHQVQADAEGVYAAAYEGTRDAVADDREEQKQKMVGETQDLAKNDFGDEV